jgi:hypothetical protein
MRAQPAVTQFTLEDLQRLVYVCLHVGLRTENVEDRAIPTYDKDDPNWYQKTGDAVEFSNFAQDHEKSIGQEILTQ